MNYLKKILVLCLLCYLFQSHYVFAQCSYSNEAILIFNSALQLQNQRKYELSEQKYNLALKLQPNFKEAQKNLSILYQNWAYERYSHGDYVKSIYCAKKSMLYKPTNVAYSYQIIAQSYLALNDYENAVLVYNKLLSINPEDKVAQQNLKYANYQHSEKVLSESINNLSISHIAPTSLYRLIKPASGIAPDAIEKTKTIIDLIWGEPSGQIILKSLLKKKVPINITQVALSANAMKTSQKYTFYLYGFIPIGSLTSSKISVNIPLNHISNFNDASLTAHQRIYDLQVFVHEFGHAFMSIKNPQNFDSIEEELGVSMLGYNVAHKIITGKYLDKEQTQAYAMGCLEALLSDEHRNLPVFSGFSENIQKYGIMLPYPEIYKDIPSMYKTLLKEGKTSVVPSFSEYCR